MKTEHLEYTLPGEIEKRSFEIIENELTVPLDKESAPVIKRIIHTTADFDYAESVRISDSAIALGLDAIKHGATIVTDTNMAKSGINAAALKKFGGNVLCFMSDEDIAKAAKQNGTTRAVASIEKAASLDGPLIFAIGNAPTALFRLCELIDSGEIVPELVIGIPVGFVNVVESKQRLMDTNAPYITSIGRKGGSTVAAAICNALIYMAISD